MLLTAVLALATASADPSFANRVARAKVLETNVEGKAYQPTMWDKIGNPATDALKGCLASNRPADTSPFTLVADIGTDGRPARVEVKPATPVARCFAGQFAAWSLPTPPRSPAPYPVEIDFTIEP